VSVHTSRGRATPKQARGARSHTCTACRSHSHRLGAVAALRVRLVSSRSLAKLIAGSRGRDAGWMRRRRAWCANAVGKLRTADRPRQIRRRRRLTGRLRVPLTVAWARQGSAHVPRQTASSFASWEATHTQSHPRYLLTHVTTGWVLLSYRGDGGSHGAPAPAALPALKLLSWYGVYMYSTGNMLKAERSRQDKTRSLYVSSLNDRRAPALLLSRLFLCHQDRMPP
jgi:hypothetical protein